MKTWCAMLIACCVLCFVPTPVLAAGSGVENVTAQFADSAKTWENTIKGHAVKLFWLLASIAAVWTFAVLVMRQADLPDVIGAVVRFVFVSWFFYWVLDNGSGFAQKILESTQQIGDEAAGTNGLDYGAFAKMGLDVLVQVNSHISIWSPIIAGCALLLAILILIAVGLITVNIILVTAETWIAAYAGLIFLGFGAAEWTRDMAVNYYRTMLAYGIKLLVTLLLAGIGLDILHNVQAQAGQGWGTDLMTLGKALLASAILLGVIGKAPGAVAGITGVSTNGAGGHGWASFLAGVGTAVTIGSGPTAAAAQGGKELGSAVRNAVKQGQAFLEENHEARRMNSATAFLFGFGACLLLWIAAEVSWPRRRELEPTPEEEIGLDRKKNPWRFWLFRTTRFCFPGAIELWIDLVRACRKKEDIEKERNEGRYS